MTNDAPESMISTRNLGKTYNGRKNRAVVAVRGVDLCVSAGEIVGFLGPNGAGKTTTMRMLTTLLRPTCGNAVVAGRDLLTDPKGVRARIGYVAQGSGVSPESRVAEELELQGRLYGLSKQDSRRRVGQLVDELDLGEVGTRRIKTLSGGQRRRLDVALGLIHTPRLVFLDEPTTGLDPQSRANLWQHIARLRDEHGMTVFVTTHYLDEADVLADRVFVMDRGSVVASGTPDDLKSEISGDGVSVTVASADVAVVTDVVSDHPGVSDISVTTDTIRFRVPHGGVVVPSLIRSMDAHHVDLKSIEVTRPGLDDVFFSLTGRSLRDSSAKAIVDPPTPRTVTDAA